MSHLSIRMATDKSRGRTSTVGDDCGVGLTWMILRGTLGVVLEADAKRALDEAVNSAKPDARLQRRIEAVVQHRNSDAEETTAL